jgi:hypothetical protein
MVPQKGSDGSRVGACMQRFRSRPGSRATAPLLAATAAFTFGCAASSEDLAPEEAAAQATRIVALVVVDQLRPDLLERYASLWRGGFRRLAQEGYRFSNASHAHAFTETAPGHATLSTGVNPASHGIVGNDWWEVDGDTLREVYGFGDHDSPILGVPRAEGRGPRNLLRAGLGEWVRAAGANARILSVSRKDRSAIAMGGRVASAHVYWLHVGSGRFVTSGFYRDDYPDWVEAFNSQVMRGVMDDTVWTSAVPAEGAALSTPDTVAAEGDQVHTAFPHRAWSEADDTTRAARNAWVARTPVMDSAVLELALAGMYALEMGRDEVPDFLALGFSQMDYVGHDYGPLSREQLDNLLRIDLLLGSLLDALDEAAGANGWVLALSSDHGVLSLPEGNGDGAPPGRRMTSAEGDAIRAAAARWSESSAREDDGSPELLEIAALPGVAAVYPARSLMAGERPDSFAALFANGHYPGRFPDRPSAHGLLVRPDPNLLNDLNNERTNHGSPYWYDRHVPIVFLGAGVAPGVSAQAVHTFDVAPTLARLAALPFPQDLDGRPLTVGPGAPGDRGSSAGGP